MQLHKTNHFLMSILDFFRTAPHTKSRTVTNLEKAGKSDMLIKAIEEERRSRGKEQGQNANIIVRRVGVHS